ncbi:MAG: adenylate/guanylate cyclase domain-containing protein [bacterium]
MDPQPSAVPAWGPQDVVGSPSSGCGSVVPYLLDVQIPEACVHFADPAQRSAYNASSNAMVPSWSKVLDYSWPGFINAPRDDDGVVRRAPLVLGIAYRDGGTGAVRRAFVPSFGLMAALLHLGVKFPLSAGPAASVEVYMGREVKIRAPGGVERRLPLDDAGNIWMDFRRRSEDLPTVSLAEFADDSGSNRAALVSFLRPYVDRHIVMVGAVAAGMGDVGMTPLSASTPFVHVHATVALNVLEGRSLRPLSPWEAAGLAFGLWLAASLTAWRWRPTVLVVTAALGLVLLGVASQALLILWGVLLPVVWPSVFVVLAVSTAIGLRYVTSERERRRIRALFAPLVSEPVLAFLEERPDQIALSGELREVSVLMLDIVHFATLTEHLKPEQVTRVINAWYGPATEAILECGGYVDKYIGDAIMAVWGAPYSSATHAADACRAALAQAVVLARVNASLQQEYGVTLRVRAAIGSGPVVAGLFGCGRRMQYSVMGHTVNLASRMESLNTDYGTAIVIDSTTRAAVAGDFVTRWLDDVQLAGLSSPTAIYELVGMRGEVPAGRLALIEAFESARSAYVGRRWSEARALLEPLLAKARDPAAVDLLARIAVDERTAPPSGWRGERLRAEKR